MDDDEEEESVMQSVEVKTDYKVDVDMGGTENDKSGFRESLGSIPEATEEDLSGSPTSSRTIAGGRAIHGDLFRRDCARCAWLKDKPSLLRKHLRRASKPYFCPSTPECNKTFGSKNDLMRHHNSRNWPLEKFVCAISRPEDGSWACSKTFSDARTLQQHITSSHGYSPAEAKNSAKRMRAVDQNYSHEFWCGICKELIELDGDPEKRRNSMFSHLVDHVEGKIGAVPNEAAHWQTETRNV